MTTLPSDLIRREASAVMVRPSIGPGPRPRAQRRLLWSAVALIAWALLGAWLLIHPRPTEEDAVTLTSVLLGLALGVLTDLGPVSLLFALARRLRGHRAGPILTTLLPAPRGSARAAGIDLPDGARPLILNPFDKEKQP